MKMMAAGPKMTVMITGTSDESISERAVIGLKSDIASKDHEYSPWVRLYTPVLVQAIYL